MFAKPWRIGVPVCAVAAMSAAVFFLHERNVMLRAQVVELRHRGGTIVQLREENRRTRDLLTRMGTDEKNAAQALHLESIRVRNELAELEGRMPATATRKGADPGALAINHDPEKGVVRLEDFQNVGRSAPGAALQTVVWAALKGDEHVLVSAVSVTGVAREKAEALIAGLPEASRAKYPTPESLAALVLTEKILNTDSAQIVGTTFTDSRHAIVSLRSAESEKEDNVPMELSADAWKIVVPEKAILGLRMRMIQQAVEKSATTK